MNERTPPAAEPAEHELPVEPAAAESPEEPAYRFPWPPPPDEPTASAFLRTWRDSVFSPTRFFRRMAQTGSAGMALLYFLIIGVVAAGFNLFWRSVFQTMLGVAGLLSSVPPMLGASPDPWSPLVGFLLSPLILLVEIGVVFVVVHTLLWMLGGARAGAATTFRVLCFAYGPQVFAIIPGLGSLVGLVWMFVLAIIGLREAHRTDAWRAALAVVLPAVLAVGFLAVIGIIAALAAIRLG